MELPEETKIFLVEGYELIDSVEALLLALEKKPADAQSLHMLFRGLHTIKGNAGFLGFANLEKLCHRAESVLDKARSGVVTIDAKLASCLLTSVDIVRSLFSAIENQGDDSGVAVDAAVKELGQWLDR